MNEPDAILHARTLCHNGHPQEALLCLDAARKHTASPALFIEIASVLDSMNLSAQAQTVLEQGSFQFADTPSMIIAFANHCYKHHQPARGLKATARLAAAASCPHDGWLTHAHLLKAVGQVEEASRFYHNVLKQDSNNCVALSSLGGIALDARLYPAAIDYYRRAHALYPDNAHVETQLAYAEFRSGDLRNGWTHYEARFGSQIFKGSVERRHHPFPEWDGRPIPRGTLLVWCEQAAGEELLYSSMFRDAQGRCQGQLTVACDKRLKPLFERTFKGIHFIARCNPPNPVMSHKTIQAQCSAGQLGRFFRTHFSDFPEHPQPFLADPVLVRERRACYEKEKIRLGKTGRIIGISWKSKPFLQGDPKSCSFSDWSILFNESPHIFVSLQYGDITDEVVCAQNHHWPLFVDDTVRQTHSLDDFAAQVCAMDNVVSVSNTTAHMAGACHIPCALLLPASRGLMWHWFDKESPDAKTALTRSPWYPCATLLRQEKDGVWDDVLAKAQLFLNNLK